MSNKYIEINGNIFNLSAILCLTKIPNDNIRSSVNPVQTFKNMSYGTVLFSDTKHRVFLDEDTYVKLSKVIIEYKEVERKQ